MDDVAEHLKTVLACQVAFAYKAKGYHWNVMGPSFPQLHAFYGDLYADLDSAVDDIAENIRKCGALVPPTVQGIIAASAVGSNDPGTDPVAMAKDALMANTVLLDALKGAFDAAEACDMQGLMDYLAGRIDTHHKHAWMLSSILGVQNC